MADDWTYSTETAAQPVVKPTPKPDNWSYSSDQPTQSPNVGSMADQSGTEARFWDESKDTPKRLTPQDEEELRKFYQTQPSADAINSWWVQKGFGGLANAPEVERALRQGKPVQGVNYGASDNPETAIDKGNDIADAVQDDLAESDAQFSKLPVEEQERIKQANLAASANAPVASAPPVEGFWSGVGSKAKEAFSEAGETLTGAFMRNADEAGEEQSIRAWVQQNGGTPEEAENLLEQARQNRARMIQEERASRGRYWSDQDARSNRWALTNFARDVIGEAAGDPIGTFIPQGGAATRLGRIGEAALLNTGIDAAVQADELNKGIQDHFDPSRSLLNAVAGSAVQGGFELPGAVRDALKAPEISATPQSNIPVEGEPGLPGPMGMEGEAGIPGPRFTPKKEAPVTVDQAVNRINDIAKDWKNSPEIEVVNSVDDITDPVIKGSIDDPTNTLGFLGEDGKVRIIAGNLTNEAEIPAILFHEALGHHGLAQKFGKDLDNLLTRMYESGGKFKNDVDEFLDRRPDYARAYADDPNPKARIVEEILAGRSESGIAVPPNILAKAKHYLKELGRKMGMNIEFNDLEVQTILGMAHDATINGKPTAASNGFRYSMEGEKFSKDTVIDDRFKREDTLLRREVKKKNTEKSYEDWKRNWEFDNFIDELEAKRLANGSSRYMKREAGPGSEGMSTDMSRRAADEAASPYTGMGKIRTNRPDVPAILEEAAPTRDQESWDEWIDAAKQVRKSAEKHAKDLNKGGAEPADVIAARVGSLNLANRISDLSKKIGQGTGTEHDKYTLAQEMVKLAALEDAITGVVGNAARIQNSMKIEIASDTATNRAIRYMSKNLGSLEDVEGIARKINDFQNNPEAVQQLAKDALKPLPEDYVTSFRYTAMLSGLGTPVKAVVGTMSNMLFENTKDAVAVGIGALKRPFTDSERLTAREWGARNVAMIKSVIEATKAAGKSYVSGHAINAPDRLEIGHASLPGSIVTEYPKRTLAAIDGFFREIIRGGEINGLAVRQALKEGIEPDSPEWNARIDELITNPTKEMEDIATKKADLQQLLDNDSRILKGMETLTRRTTDMNAVDRIIRFAVQNIFPFTRNIDNIMRQTLRNSPIGFFSKNVQADLKAGGARRDQAMARIIVGSTLLYFAGEYAANGLATGQGNTNLDMEALNVAAGRPANSVKIGDEWVSLEGFDAISAPFNAAASARIAWDKGEIDDKTYLTRMLKATGAIASSLYDTTIIEQMDKFTGLFDKRNQNTELAVSLPASFVPAAVRQYTQWGEDRASLDTRGDKSFGDRVVGRTLSGLPEGIRTWIAEKLDFGEMPQKMDVFGRGVRREGDPLAAATGIGRGTVEDTDPGVQEVLRLSEKFGKVLVTKTEDEFTVDGQKIKLSPTERQQWQYLAGQLILEEINGALKDPVWSTLSDEEKADEIKLIVKDSKKNVKDEIFAKYLEPEEEEGVDDGFIYE